MPVTKVKSTWTSGGLVFKPNNVSVTPSTMITIGDTNGVNLAGGVTALYGWVKQVTTAVTGTARGLRGNANVLIASAAGTAIGVTARAANGTSGVATDGVNLGAAYGVHSQVVGVGQSGPATLSLAVGVYSQLDIDAADLTISDARGLYVNVQGGGASNNTLTLCNLAYLEYESVSGTAQAINSAIKIATVGGATGATCLIDASTFNLGVTNTDEVLLMKFKNSAGAVVSMYWDTSDSDLAFSTA